MEFETFIEKSKPFIEWMLDWKASLSTALWTEIVSGRPGDVGIVCVDLIKGFCTVGPLSSPRVVAIVHPIRELFQMAWRQGIRDIALPCDAHPADAVEFNQYGRHCVAGTPEAEVVDEIQGLPFYPQLSVIDKNCINASLNAEFLDWVNDRPHIRTWIVVGDCTDICTYQLALFLRVRANENQERGVRVILPLNAVDTYDLPVVLAREIGAVPHDGDFLHLVFLYHMMLNGVEIYTEITG